MRVPELDDAESAEKKSGYESIEIVRVRFDAFETRVLDFKRPSTRVDRFHLASSIINRSSDFDLEQINFRSKTRATIITHASKKKTNTVENYAFKPLPSISS